MPKESYDPKLSQAGFMDLVCALQERLKTPDGTTTLATMPEVQRDAALRLGEAAKAYVDVVEGRADQSSDLMEKVVKALMTHKMVVMCDVIFRSRLHQMSEVNCTAGKSLASYCNRSRVGTDGDINADVLAPMRI